MEKAMSDASDQRGWAHALGGLLAALLGVSLIAQAGGSDRELFLTIGMALGAVGLLGIVIGGVAIGIQLARE
ncbi:hypothetical protein [Nocardioides lijunqiniae]|uniref:hypothetical protein n=1 Tax=Nocardioides lijunqiniae TaxID=2760832 RepID=UPI001877A13C|nr:hypothetical protein [Nocardioides lijunqiniae]